MAKINLNLLAEMTALAQNADLAAIQGKINQKREAKNKLDSEIIELEAKIGELVSPELAALLKSKEEKGSGSGSKGNAKAKKPDVPDSKTLVDLLKKADGKKLNRKGFSEQGFNLPSAITIAKEDAKTFGFEQNGAQGSVWLKK